MWASRANTMPREIAPTAITAQPINAVVPKRASTEGAMKNPEPTMLPITSAVQVASPRLLLPRWSVAGVTVAPFTARRRSFRQRHEAEEGQGARGGLPEDARVDVSDLSRSVQAAQRAVHDQAEILVAARQSKGERLVRVMAREDGQMFRRRTPRCGVQEDRLISEQHVRTPPRYPLDTFRVARHGDDFRVDVEILSPLGEPRFRGRSGHGRKHPLLENLCQRRAPERPVGRLPSLERRPQALGGVLSHERADAARKDRDRERDFPSPLQRGGGCAAE